MKRMNAAMMLAMLASTGASVELASDMAVDRDAFKRAASEPMSIPFRGGRAASSLAALDFWSRQRLRARQTHPGKRGRP